MSPDHALLFGPYRLDPVNGDLWRGQELLKLPPKPLAVLCYLAKHRGRLVSKEELLDSVWGSRWLSETVLKITIKTIRQVLQDDPKAPCYIETRARRGYRFIAELTGAVALPLAETAPAPASPLVGREEMLVRLRGVLEKALRGSPTSSASRHRLTRDGSSRNGANRNCVLWAISPSPFAFKVQVVPPRSTPRSTSDR